MNWIHFQKKSLKIHDGGCRKSTSYHINVCKHNSYTTDIFIYPCWWLYQKICHCTIHISYTLTDEYYETYSYIQYIAPLSPRLTRSLEDSQRHVEELLAAGTGQEAARLKLQLQEVIAGKSITEDLNAALQEEINDLKEQVHSGFYYREVRVIIKNNDS